jgi:phage terminase large subunit-like protein
LNVHVQLDPLAGFCASVGLALEPFQEVIADALTGPEHEVVILLPRGQGKTSLVAALALQHLATTPAAAVYCAAASREQARILFEAADRYARRLEDDHVVHRHLELRWCDNPDTPKVFSRHLRVLAADAPRLHGLTPTLAVIDELHAHRDDEVYLALKTAALKTPGARLVVISTAGQGAETPLGRLRARALGQPNVRTDGAFTDARGGGLRLLEWAVPTDADVDNPAVVKEANPASWITEEALAGQRQAVPDLAYRRYHCNQWGSGEGAWLPPGAWNKCVGTPRFTEGEPIVIAADLGGTRSASAVCWINDRHHVGCEIHRGDDAVLEIADCIRELARRYDVQEIALDPWRAAALGAELEREGLTVSTFPQQDARVIPASQRLYDAVINEKVVLPDLPELAQHAAGAIAKHSRRGWRIDRPNPRVEIDGVTALLMALDRLENRPAPVELLGWI